MTDYFTYPYDNELLLRKQKSIKRELLARDTSYVDKRIAILGGSTTADVRNMLEIFLLEAGIKPAFYESEYNKYYEDAVFPNPALEKFRPDVILVFTSMVNIVHMPLPTDTPTVVEEKIRREYERFHTVWEKLRTQYGAVIIQNNMEPSYEQSLGSLDAVLPAGANRFIAALNERFAAYASTQDNFYLYDLNAAAARVGLNTWHNRFQYYAYKFAMNYDVLPTVAHGIANIVKAILGKTKKCLVLDLDNTLWGGIIGDDGVNGIAIGHETPQAEAYAEFQRYVLRLKERGVILAVCSKNEDDAARSGFTHPDSVLKADDFVAFKANWNPKNVNIREIAHEINIGTDSLVFIDDNPVERQLIRDTMSEVAVPEVDPNDVFSYIRAIEGAGYFETVAISEDDLKRSEAYRGNQLRRELESTVTDYGDFLRSLDMQAEIAPFRPVYFDRIAQLTNKSNQFNLTTLRCTLADISGMAENPQYITIYGRLKDKFGDNGLISVVVGEKRGDELHIILWLMSCRVLKRGMEDAMLDALARAAHCAGMKSMVGYYYPTKKNRMVAHFYEEMGFDCLAADEEQTVWTCPVEGYAPRNRYIDVQESVE